MKGKQLYEARFTGRTIYRTSAHEYTAAWAVLRDGRVVSEGFSKDAIHAERAANGRRNEYTHRNYLRRGGWYGGFVRDYDRKHGQGSFLAEVEEAEKMFTIEIVEAHKVEAEAPRRGGKRQGAGRPVGTTRGKKQRISIGIDPEKLAWLKKQPVSYAKVINRLIEKEMEG